MLDSNNQNRMDQYYPGFAVVNSVECPLFQRKQLLWQKEAVLFLKLNVLLGKTASVPIEQVFNWMLYCKIRTLV